jgi:hypothetical protein
MKTRITNTSLSLILAASGVAFFASCAGMETNSTRSLLSAAGFRPLTPKNAKEQELYAAVPNNKIERATVKGKVFYVFKDEKAGVAYIGGEPQHRRYEKLSANAQRAAEEEMNPSLAAKWANQWGPHHDFWSN